MTTMQCTQLGIPRWMALAMPEDVSQIVSLVDLEYATKTQRQASLDYYLRELRRTQWDRRPGRPARKPRCLRPSKVASGYRTDSVAHATSRLKVNPAKRRAIARKGSEARWNVEISLSHS